jgi:hypothetical protein
VKIPKQLAIALVLLTAVPAMPLWAQTSSTPGPGAPRYPQQPCWQQAGISRSVMPQIRQIHQSTHSQVESVCGNSSLTPQQKQQEIHQLHQQAQQQIEGLVSSQQLQALRSCQEQRGHSRAMQPGGNPCGNTSATAPPLP